MSKKYKHHGVMDCHGIESLHEYNEKDAFFKQLRATANDQRQAIYFEANLTDDEWDTTITMLSQQKFKDACLYLKTCKDIKFRGPGNINLIPNSKIDPWGGNDKEEDATVTKQQLVDAGLEKFVDRIHAD
tara:strand:- start:787 stop:1176 length:390 start_codon:yes stop_codon:yes gene_type:complete